VLHCAQKIGRAQADFFGKWVELMDIYVARAHDVITSKGQIPLRYLVADRFEAGRGPVAYLLARASSLLAS